MAETTKKPPSSLPEHPAASPATSRWDRLADDIQKRPKYYAALLVGVMVLASGVFFAVRHFRLSAKSELLGRHKQLRESFGLNTAKQQLQALEGLAKDFRGIDEEPSFLLSLARAYREAADEAESHDAKLLNYRKAIETVKDLENRFPKHPLVVTPWQPTPQATGEPNPTTPGRIREYAQSQVEFLSRHAFDRSGDQDSGCTFTVTLIDPEGQEHVLEIAVYSKLAPHAVHAFHRMATTGYYDGTSINAVERSRSFRSNTPGPVQALVFGSAMAKVAPDRPETWMQASDSVGFTLPREKTRLTPKKGSVALDWIASAHGQSPVRVAIFTSEAQFTDRGIFGTVTKGADVLDRFAEAKAASAPIPGTNSFHLEDAWKIKSVTVSGSVAVAPESPILDEVRLPEAPKPEDR